jgi:hypothetical protein
MLGRAIVASALAVAFCCTATTAGSARLVVHSGCPPGPPRTAYPMTIAQVVGAARSKVIGEMTHYQGRATRRTAANTPVSTVFMFIGASRFSPGAPQMARWARQTCGSRIAAASHGVVFHDSLSVIADAVVVKFVVKTGRGVWVY